jgi:hypothetical protein
VPFGQSRALARTNLLGAGVVRSGGGENGVRLGLDGRPGPFLPPPHSWKWSLPQCYASNCAPGARRVALQYELCANEELCTQQEVLIA